MRNSIRKKLLTSGLIVLLLIILMVVANQVVSLMFKNTSNKLVVEYNELDAIQEFKLSLGNLTLPLSSYAVYGNNNDELYYNILSFQAKENLKVCKLVVTDRHEVQVFNDFELLLQSIDSISLKIFQCNIPNETNLIKVYLEKTNQEVSKGISMLDVLLNETKLEIDEYTNLNNTVIKHSTITIFSLGILIILIILIGGWLVVSSITNPINELVNATNRISQGERSAEVDVTTDDEFKILADSFNHMVNTLDKTTVSKNYLNNILRNMFDSLVVTDNELKIKSINKAAIDILEYTESDLLSQKIDVLFKEPFEESLVATEKNRSFNYYKDKMNDIDQLKSKSGKLIPVLNSCTILKDEKNEPRGIIMVSHNLTKQKAIEKILEQSRKKRLREINEAQEEERLRIATDIHDGLGQMLTAISYSVQELNNEEKKGDVEKSVSDIIIQINRTIHEAKNLAHNLIPIVLKDFGLIVAIDNLITKANNLYNINLHFSAFDFKERIEAKKEKALYRICQEALNNIVKHSKASNATFQILKQDASVVLVIEDDGIGFEDAVNRKKDSNSGIGLMSMRERVLSFNGILTINSELNKGTEIIVEIPC